MPYVAPDHSYTSLEVALLKQLDLPKIEDYTFLKDFDVLNYIGVTIEDAKQYVDCIVNEFPEFVEKMANRTYSDALLKFCSIGKPSLFYSKALKSVLSAHAARYIYHALLAIKQIQTKFPGQKVNLLEIGAGFGGECFWIQTIAPEVVQSYSIVDLPLVCKFQEKILAHLGVPCKFSTIPDRFSTDEAPLFVISSYSFSSLNKYYQDLYNKFYLSRSAGGFMVWNNWTGYYPFGFQYRIEIARPNLNKNTFMKW
jgi:hypothetical protein